MWAQSILIAVFVVGIIHDLEAARLPVIAAAECHIPPHANPISVLNVTDEIDECLPSGVGIVLPLAQAFGVELGQWNSSPRFDREAAHRRLFVAVFWNRFKDFGAREFDGCIALGDRSWSSAYVGDDPFYFERPSWAGFFQADAFDNELWSKGCDKGLLGRVGRFESGISRTGGVFRASLDQTQLPDEQRSLPDRNEDERQCQGGDRLIRRRSPEGFPYLLVAIYLIGISGVFTVRWIMNGSDGKNSHDQDTDNEERD